MIEFKGTGFTYDGERFVLDGVDARIERGEFVCILGGNGSGKSTLAKHVNALLVPDEGSVTVLDRDTRDERSTYFIRSNAGMVFQNPDDQLVASLIENDVAFGPENLGVPTDQLRQRVADALADWGCRASTSARPRRCRAGRSNAWPSPACWPWSPPSSSWTRPPAVWILPRSSGSSRPPSACWRAAPAS